MGQRFSEQRLLVVELAEQLGLGKRQLDRRLGGLPLAFYMVQPTTCAPKSTHECAI